LPAQDRTYTVRYDAHAGQPHFVHIPEQDQVVVLADPRIQADVCCRLLQKWLKEQARKSLVPRAFSLSTKHELPIARVQIRKQKTRWASMSTIGTLSLNCHLMFLDSELVQHVLLHELCHVRHPNHGPGFRALLSRLSPHEARYERAIKHVHQTMVPWWARF
jgi:predicted metal-dependent hydrolase